ncbi:Hypothetical protein PENO1_111810 [Penicillium occitanis (nom. inval.)]|nr:Hypothetical protein PENO1_111810 [Penicillium occitanis (nom. inval.)]PCG88205.1 hypothetical protein PENOC_112070 [Penicillium occitanis (nom. inval.)]
MDPQDARVVGSKERTEAPLELNLDDPIVFDMEILEDIPAELQAFVRLSRLDLFQEASDWFEKCLSRHRHMFPVFTEYADMLLQQGSYSELVKVLDDMDIKYLTALGSTDPADVSQLFRVMKTLAIVRWRGISEGELSDAMRCWDYLKERYTDKAGQDEEPNGVQIRIVEIYLSIVVAILESNLHEGMDKYTNPPWTSPKSPKWLGFCAWYTTLKQNGFHWEAQKIQSILLPIVGLEDAMKTFIRKDQFTAVADDIKAGRFDESLPFPITAYFKNGSRWTNFPVLSPQTQIFITGRIFGVTKENTQLALLTEDIHFLPTSATPIPPPTPSSTTGKRKRPDRWATRASPTTPSKPTRLQNPTFLPDFQDESQVTPSGPSLPTDTTAMEDDDDTLVTWPDTELEPDPTPPEDSASERRSQRRRKTSYVDILSQIT